MNLSYDDPELLRTLIAEHTPRLLQKAIALCGDVDQADDLVQATWMQAHLKRTSFRGRGTFAAWINTIMRHTFINDRRAQLRREQCEQDSAIDPSVERDIPVITITDGLTDIPADAYANTDEQIGHLVRAILTLAPRERRIFVLRAIVGHSVRDVADMLGCAPGTVKSTFAHAVTRLRADVAARVRGDGE